MQREGKCKDIRKGVFHYFIGNDSFEKWIDKKSLMD